jgi:hypothetical protein
MKAYIDGMRSLLYYVGYCDDKAEISNDEAEKEKLKAIVEILIPICKGYTTDRAYDVCNIGMQVYGGYGYIKEYPQEQLVRDCRITMIYEGTNGIQAMDLLGRKLAMDQGKAVMVLFGEIQATIEKAKGIAPVKDLAAQVEKAVQKLGKVGMQMGTSLMSQQIMNAFAFAVPFMEVAGDTVLAWMLLWRASLAAERLAEGAKKKDIAFYEGQLKGAEYFINVILPATSGKMNAILGNNSAVIDISEESFGG